jgi:SAM-dependent methyltransferase
MVMRSETTAINVDHLHRLQEDFKEAKDPFKKAIIDGKLAYYAFRRPIDSFVIHRRLEKRLREDAFFKHVDRFLLNEGGMFKKYAYNVWNHFYPLKGAAVLVPGVGYGRSLFQLALFKPKIIVAFDLYEYSEEWALVSKKLLDAFGVPVLFFQGDFDNLPRTYLDFFDFVISDAVLEHVKDLPAFAEHSKRLLKDNGIFYASFGPIWFGPGGDHLYWGSDRLFDHLTLPEDVYRKNFEARFPHIHPDSTEGAFIVAHKLLSYLEAKDYLEILSRQGFQKLLLFAKIAMAAIALFKRKPEINELLDRRALPAFDRFCSGIYLWMRLIKSQDGAARLVV